jgi:DNA-binding Lrp family transcriptional regulator
MPRARRDRPRHPETALGRRPDAQPRSCLCGGDPVVNLPGVIEVFHVAGGTDYLLHVATADTTALHDFILEYFAASPAIQHAEASLVFRHLRGTNVLPAD